MLNHELINLRYAGSTSPYYPALYTGELKRVAPWIAVKTTTWESWPWHKQQLALTLAAGLVRTARHWWLSQLRVFGEFG